MKMRFDKKRNQLSRILFECQEFINYEEMNSKLRYCVVAHLNGKLHMGNVYRGNLPLCLRDGKHMEQIELHKFEWSLEAQEYFIKNSIWFKTNIEPIIVYEQTRGAFKGAEISEINNLSNSLFHIKGSEFSVGSHIWFANVPNALPFVIADILLRNHSITLDGLFGQVKKNMPLRQRPKDMAVLEKQIVILLKKWNNNGYLICRDLLLYLNKSFFPQLIKELTTKTVRRILPRSQICCG